MEFLNISSVIGRKCLNVCWMVASDWWIDLISFVCCCRLDTFSFAAAVYLAGRKFVTAIHLACLHTHSQILRITNVIKLPRSDEMGLTKFSEGSKTNERTWNMSASLIWINMTVNKIAVTPPHQRPNQIRSPSRQVCKRMILSRDSFEIKYVSVAYTYTFRSIKSTNNTECEPFR